MNLETQKWILHKIQETLCIIFEDLIQLSLLETSDERQPTKNFETEECCGEITACGMTHQVASSLKLSLLVIVLSLAATKAQIGSECSETKRCYDHQKCFHGYCSCDRGFVRNHRHCFRVRSYGETCFFDVQCNDHRMVCERDNNNTSVKRCLCDRMHVWSKEREECLMTLNITEMLATLEVREYSEKRSKDDQKVFVGVVIAGITVVIVGAVLTFFCIFYGCCLYECVDKWQILESGEEPRRSKCSPSCPEFVKSTAPKSGFT